LDPVSVPEIRRRLWRLVLALEQTVQHILAWSRWRRWHQTMSQYHHDRRRGALLIQLSLQYYAASRQTFDRAGNRS
jgi:hypothetical protein